MNQQKVHLLGYWEKKNFQKKKKRKNNALHKLSRPWECSSVMSFLVHQALPQKYVLHKLLLLHVVHHNFNMTTDICHNIYSKMNIHICTYHTYIHHTHINARIYVCIYMSIYTHVHACVHTKRYMCNTHICTYLYVCMYMR